jgi:hypothetical protein
VSVADWLDLILVALSLLFAASGYRLGFAIGVLSLTGFVCGAAAGAIVAPGVSRVVASGTSGQAMVAVLVEFGAAAAGMLLLSRLGAVIKRLSRFRGGFLDSLGGAVLYVVATLAIALLISAGAASGPSRLISGQLDDSLILRSVSHIMPRNAVDLLNSIRLGMVTRVMDSSGIDPAELPLASLGVLTSHTAAIARQDVVKIEGSARSCTAGSLVPVQGSGFVISPGHVITNAHVVAGLRQPPEVLAASGRSYRAKVVLYDPRTDIAVLDVPGLRASALHFTGSAPNGADAIVAGYPRAGHLTFIPASIGRSFLADIAGTAGIEGIARQVYQIRAQVQPGDSGGPLMAPDGRVYGVVFASSTTTPQLGWALTAAEVARDADAGEYRITGVPTPPQLTC